MTDQKLIKLEKEIALKVKTPEVRPGKKFVVDVAYLKKLAKKINAYESASHASAQR